MARVDVPSGPGRERERVWELLPAHVGQAAQDLRYAVQTTGQLTDDLLEAVRLAIGEINACELCQIQTAVPDGDLSSSERIQLACDYARRFATNHESIDDAYWHRLKQEFTDPELVALTVFTCRNLAFGRLSRVLMLDGG